MKKMKYSEYPKVEVLHSGEYKGYKFAILNLGKYPTAYVENKNEYLDEDEIDFEIEVHGGFNYFGNAHWDETDNTPYFGWDYGHIGDWLGCASIEFNQAMNNKKWTTEEVFAEVQAVIDTLSEAKR